MADEHTTVIVARYINELADASGASAAEPIVRALLASSVDRLHVLCATLLHRSYPRLTKPPLNLQSEEMLSAVVERLLKAMRALRPATPRQFFALANKHMRWELNDLARKMDKQGRAVELNESAIAAPSYGSDTRSNELNIRILEAIEGLPEEEREAFSLIHIQGLQQVEAAEMLGTSTRTIQRWLNRSLLLLNEKLRDLQPNVRSAPLAAPDGEAPK